MPFNTKPLVKDVYASPAPQYFNTGTDSYEVVEGANGAAKTTIQGRSSHISLETNATTTEANSPFAVDYISVLINDGTDDIKFNFDANTSSPGTITLKPGESLTDFPRKCNTIYYKAVSGTQAFRAWGVK